MGKRFNTDDFLDDLEAVFIKHGVKEISSINADSQIGFVGKRFFLYNNKIKFWEKPEWYSDHISNTNASNIIAEE